MNSYQKVIRGRDSLKKLPEMMNKLHVSNPMIIGNDQMISILMRNHPFLFSSTVFSSFHTKPDFSDAVSGSDTYSKSSCDGLVSIGGCSSIDTAKAIKACLNTVSKEDIMQNRFFVKKQIPHIAVPGTAGTGSEATQFAEICMDGIKVSLDHEMLRPDGAVLDSALLDFLPEYHKSTSALCALAHGVESYWSSSYNDDCRVHAYLAIIGILDNMNAYLKGNPHAADEILDASYQSGKAIQMKKTTAVSEIAGVLACRSGISYGHACMLTITVLWEMMAEREELMDVLSDLSLKMRLGSLQMAPRLLKGIMYDLELPIPQLPDGIALDELADTVNMQKLNHHPVRITREDIKEIYRRAMTPMCANERKACVDIWRYYGR